MQLMDSIANRSMMAVVQFNSLAQHLSKLLASEILINILYFGNQVIFHS